LSILRTPDAPQDRHLHLCVPADVLPFFAIPAPHELHFGLFTPHLPSQATFCSEKLA
jgi:hypothetical protein